MDAREESRARWERAAQGWRKRADEVRQHSLPLSIWMVEHARLQPGQRVLELAAGPGDTGFLAAELIAPSGTLISSDANEAMLDIARERAAALGVKNVEFSRLELEWIDLPAASVDTVLCRWGVMLIPDPPAALKEIRRVLRPGGCAVLAVWDLAERNPWATIDDRALIELGHMAPREDTGPGMFALAAPGQLEELLEEAGFEDIVVDGVDLAREYESIEEFIDEARDLSVMFADVYDGLDAGERDRFARKLASLAEPYARAGGSVLLPGRSLVAVAGA